MALMRSLLTFSIKDSFRVTQSALAEHIGVLPKTINEICRGKRGVSADMALKLSQALGATPYFWLNLQNNSELSQISSPQKIKTLAA